MDAANAYADRVDAVQAQRSRLQRHPPDDTRWDRDAPGYRFDPLRAPEPNLEQLASYLRPDDDVLEVGGGAGRIGLPLARQCRSVTNVEPSAGMRAQFAAAARAAGIHNVRVVAGRWPLPVSSPVAVALTVDVTYFIRDIVPFVRALSAAAQRRVIISLWAVPPPARDAALFRLVFGEDQIVAPGHRELLPVLWEMGVLPEVRVHPESFTWPEPQPATRAAAIQFALDQMQPRDREASGRRVEEHFDALFASESTGAYRPLWRPSAPGLLITWATTA